MLRRGGHAGGLRGGPAPGTARYWPAVAHFAEAAVSASYSIPHHQLVTSLGIGSGRWLSGIVTE